MHTPHIPAGPAGDGRRLSTRKHDAILVAAEACFAENGFAASMDAVAQAAGVSKQTVYHHFGSKDALFEAVVQAITERLRAPLFDDDAARRPPRDTLVAFGRGALRMMLDEQGLTLLRLLMTETPKSAELRQVLVTSGMDPMAAAVAAYLRAETARGRLAIADARQATALFLGMLAADIRLRAMLGVLPDLAPEQIDAHVDAVVDAFLRAFGVGKG